MIMIIIISIAMNTSSNDNSKWQHSYEIFVYSVRRCALYMGSSYFVILIYLFSLHRIFLFYS